MKNFKKLSSTKKSLMLIILILAVQKLLFSSEKSADPEIGTDFCKEYFDIPDQFLYPAILLFPEYHDNNEDDQKISQCIGFLAKPGDRLLIESEDTHRQLDCGLINPEYKKLNSQLACYGFDVPIDKNREFYNIYEARMRTLYRFNNRNVDVDSVLKIKNELLSLGNHFITSRKSNYSSLQILLNKKVGKYLKKLSRKLNGLNINQTKEFLLAENIKVSEKMVHYEKLSRSGPTNEAMVKNIKKHQAELHSNGQKGKRLFLVAGANHLDINRNFYLKRIINSSQAKILKFK